MKIGIVTHPLCNNYGGLLQNYALQYVLEKLGHKTKTIDFASRWPFLKYLLEICRQFAKTVIRHKVHPYPSYVIHQRKPIMDSFVNKYINKTKVVHSYSTNLVIKEKFDAVIVGSDQVWRPEYVDFPQDMFLKFVPDNVKKIAYAASFGVDYWQYPMELELECRELISRLDAVSVREESGVTLCRQYLNTDAKLVLDPTILAGREAFLSLIEKHSTKNYLFAYILDTSNEIENYIEKVAQDNGLECYICGAHDDATLNVEEWLSKIAGASIVITDSFHGTVFSILFHRNFYSIQNKNRGASRFNSLLGPLALGDRLLYREELVEFSNKLIDWTKIEELLSIKRKESLDFLVSALKS